MSASTYNKPYLLFNSHPLTGFVSKTSYLTPNSINLYDDLDARTALSFQLIMPSSIPAPTIGSRVFLAAGTTYGYVEVSGLIKNYTFSCDAGTTENGGATGFSFVGNPIYDWYAYQQSGGTSRGYVALGGADIELYNTATSDDQKLRVAVNYRGTLSSKACPLRVNTDYKFEVSYQTTLPTHYSGGGFTASIYTGAASTMTLLLQSSYVTGTKTGTWTTTFTNNTDNYFDILYALDLDKGHVEVFDQHLYEYTPNYIFGGFLDNYRITALPFTSYVQYTCNCVDFSQIPENRLIYKSYPSSGIGIYTLTNTTENFTGDGVTMAWDLAYPVNAKPTITINGVSALVTTVGGCSSAGYFYTPSSHLILGNTSNNAPASTDTLKVVYAAQVGAAAYSSQIIRDIVYSFLTYDNLDPETMSVQTTAYSPQVSEINFNYIQCDKALDNLCDITGYNWRVDPWKRIVYEPKANATLFSASFTTTSNNWRNMSVKHSRDNYRNRQYILGSYYPLTITESFAGDGYTKTFTLANPAYKIQKVMVDGVSASFGTYGVATSTIGYYFQKELNTITGNSTNSAMASTDTLTVKYQGLFPAVAIANDLTEQTAQSLLQDGSGIFDHIDTANKMYVDDAAIDYAESLIDRYSGDLATIQFETDVDGISAGMLVNISNTALGLSTSYLVTSVQGNDVNMRTMRYKVNAVNSEDTKGWIHYFKSLAKQNDTKYTEPYENLITITT